MDKVDFLRQRMSESFDYAKNYAYKDGKQLLKRWVWFRVKYVLDNFLNGKEERLLILPGIRGVGKTTLLSQLYLHLVNTLNVSRERVLFLSMDVVSRLVNSDAFEMVNLYEEKILGTHLEKLDTPVFLLLDEVHYDPKWDSALKWLYDRSKKIFIIATGSSALSIKLPLDLARRARIEEIFPLNFSEYLMFKHDIKSDWKLREPLLEIISNPSNFAAFKDRIERGFREFSAKFSPSEIEIFFKTGGFPFSIELKEVEVYQKIMQLMERIVFEDVAKMKTFETDTIQKIPRLLVLLATTQKINFETISTDIQVPSKSTVSTLLDILESSKVLISIKPLGPEEKQIAKSWRYHFITPSIRAALKHSVGLLKDENKGIFLEDYVASILLRLKETKKLFNVYYDSQKDGTDFIIVPLEGKPIPLEVGYGEKGLKQIKKSMEKFGSNFGILISETEFKFEGNILFLPKELFLIL